MKEVPLPLLICLALSCSSGAEFQLAQRFPLAQWWIEATPCPDGSELQGAPWPDGRSVYCDLAGVRHGRITEWTDEGEVWIDGEFNRGKRTGLWTAWLNRGPAASAPDAGFVEAGAYRNGVRDGRWTTWWKDGKIHNTGVIRKGKGDGVWAWYWPNGEMLKQVTYRDGQEVDPPRYWKRDGQPEWWHDTTPCPENALLRGNAEWKVWCEREDGVLHGRFTHWYPSALKKKLEGQWQNGKAVGRWRQWNQYDDGGRIEDYRDDVVVRVEELAP